MHRLILSGYGGQGMLLCGQLLAYASMTEGKNVTWFPTYGAEVRGGAAYCSVVISEKTVGNPLIRQADIVVACSQPALDKFHSFIVDGGLVLYHSAIVNIREKRDGVTYLGLDFNALANSVNYPKALNMVVLGVLSELIKTGRGAISEALKNKFEGSSGWMLEDNERAVSLGVEEAGKFGAVEAGWPESETAEEDGKFYVGEAGVFGAEEVK